MKPAFKVAHHNQIKQLTDAR